jgi:hypothetical protein
MERDTAVKFLRRRCVFDPPLSADQAESIWQPVHQAVAGLERTVQCPIELPLSAEETRLAEEAARFFEANRVPHLQAIVKVDPFQLVAHQPSILMEQAAKYEPSVRDSAGWFSEAILAPLPRTMDLQIRLGPNILEAEVPHSEFGVFFDPEGRYTIQEHLRHVTVFQIPEVDRMMLWSGYHRSYARVMSTGLDPEKRPQLMVLTDKPFLDILSVPSEREVLCGPTPPLFSDFFDERLYLTVKVRRQKFQVRVRAECVGIDEE